MKNKIFIGWISTFFITVAIVYQVSYIYRVEDLPGISADDTLYTTPTKIVLAEPEVDCIKQNIANRMVSDNSGLEEIEQIQSEMVNTSLRLRSEVPNVENLVTFVQTPVNFTSLLWRWNPLNKDNLAAELLKMKFVPDAPIIYVSNDFEFATFRFHSSSTSFAQNANSVQISEIVVSFENSKNGILMKETYILTNGKSATIKALRAGGFLQ